MKTLTVLLCDIFPHFHFVCFFTSKRHTHHWSEFIKTCIITKEIFGEYIWVISQTYMHNEYTNRYIYRYSTLKLGVYGVYFCIMIFAFHKVIRSTVESLYDKNERDVSTVWIILYERIKHNNTTHWTGFWKICNWWPNIYSDDTWGCLRYIELIFRKDVGGLESHVINVVWNARRRYNFQMNPELSEQQLHDWFPDKNSSIIHYPMYESILSDRCFVCTTSSLKIILFSRSDGLNPFVWYKWHITFTLL